LNTPADAREYFQEKHCKFYAATAFDDASQQYSDFTDYKQLFTCLVEADEIISFNGPRSCQSQDHPLGRCEKIVAMRLATP
jgi:hypothetical protein